MERVISSLLSGYVDVIKDVTDHGSEVVSRGMEHREVIGYGLHVLYPEFSLVTGTGRVLNPGIAYYEALSLIAGESYVRLLDRVSDDKFDSFKDGDVLHGAYGPRIRSQMPAVIRRLADDNGSRQAVVVIYDPVLDTYQNRRDLPCTVSLQFMVRDDALHMVTHMRSNDVYLGLPYDVFQFTQLQATVAACLNMGLGTYHHLVGSMHLYERDLASAAKVFSRVPNDTVNFSFRGVSHMRLDAKYGTDPVDCWEQSRAIADATLRLDTAAIGSRPGRPSCTLVDRAIGEFRKKR